ncbi:MAG: hypothetical protein AB8B91_16785 [Rubripirellula sp.]
MTRNVERTLGVLFWAILVGAGIILANRSEPDQTSSPQTSLTRYFAGPSAQVQAIDDSQQLRVYDPVFFQDTDSQWSQIGYIKSIESESEQGLLNIAWFRSDVSPLECSLASYRNRGRLEDVVATMLPPEKQLQIRQRLAAAMAEHGDELSASFVPLVQTSLRRSLPVIEEEFRLAVGRHRDQIDSMAERWNDEVVAERLIPLARREILPIVREHGEPTANAIGRELWDRASIWRFGWRAIYDKSPLPRQDLVQEEWDRFVEKEAVPVFESHMDDVVLTVQKIVTGVAANEVVRRELGVVAGELAADPEARELVRVILRETLVDNDRLRKVWSDVWSSNDARQALDMAGDRLEPVVRQIGDDLFGTQESGITPSFARVLRNQILGKDRRWLVAQRETDGTVDSLQATPIRIRSSRDSMPYPIVYTASDAGSVE